MLIGRRVFWRILFLTCLASSAVTAAAAPLNDFKRELTKYFGAVGYHPLLLPEGHRVGDVIEVERLSVVWEQEKCFPGLRTEESRGHLTLPSILHLGNAAASIWVKLKYLLRFEVGADNAWQVLLNLDDVSVVTASFGALRDALDEQCSELLPILEEDRMPRVTGRRVNIVAGVLRARANTVFSYSGELEGTAAMEYLVDMLGNAIPSLKALAPEFAASFGLSGRQNVVSVSEHVQTVAFRPATIFRPGFSAKDTDEVPVEPFDPANAEHLELLDLQARTWAENPDFGN